MTYVEDPEEVGMAFVVSRDDAEEFDRLLKPYKGRICTRVLIFEALLESFGIQETADEILSKYGKFAFQTLKKLYAMLALDGERFLVLDSESMWIRPTRMKAVLKHILHIRAFFIKTTVK